MLNRDKEVLNLKRVFYSKFHKKFFFKEAENQIKVFILKQLS